MTTPTHFFGGYLALSLTKKIWASDSFSLTTQKWLILYGVIFSIAIDLDVLVTHGITDHHKQLTHYPLFWLSISLLIIFTGIVSKLKVVRALGLITLIASLTHLALDLVGVTMGVHLFWPFSMQEFSITPITTSFPTEQERLIYILQSPIVWIGDSLVITISLVKMGFDYMNRSES